MSEEVLTKEIAEQFIADQFSVDLSQYTSLEEEAAITLSKSDAWQINLDGLTSLSDAAAESLSELVGVPLYLNGLKELSESVISVFIDHTFLPSLKGWSGMNDKLAEFVLCNGYQYQLSLDSKKLLIPYLPERFILHTFRELDFSIEGYEVIDRERYSELLDKLELNGSIYVPNLPDHIERELEFSELIDAFSIYKTSEDAVVAFEETLGFSSVGHSFSDDILNYEA
jgi:hypothetical protein